jgi:hypothetical protein
VSLGVGWVERLYDCSVVLGCGLSIVHLRGSTNNGSVPLITVSFEIGKTMQSEISVSACCAKYFSARGRLRGHTIGEHY